MVSRAELLLLFFSEPMWLRASLVKMKKLGVRSGFDELKMLSVCHGDIQVDIISRRQGWQPEMRGRIWFHNGTLSGCDWSVWLFWKSQRHFWRWDSTEQENVIVTNNYWWTLQLNIHGHSCTSQANWGLQRFGKQEVKLKDLGSGKSGILET